MLVNEPIILKSIHPSLIDDEENLNLSVVRAAVDAGFFIRRRFVTSQIFGIGRVIKQILNLLPCQKDMEITLIGICNFDNDLFLSSSLATYFERRFPEGLARTVPAIRSNFGLTRLHERLAPSYIANVVQQQNNHSAPKTSTLQSIALRGFIKILKTFDVSSHFAQEKYDVFFSTYLPLPSKRITGRVPRVIQIFDLIPILYPEFTDAIQTGEMQQIVKSIDPDQDWVICNAESVRQDICNYIGINPNHVMVVPLAADEHFAPETNAEKLAEVRRKHNIPSGPFLLSVAAWQPRKNMPHAIQSFFTLLEQHPELDVHLVLVGNIDSGSANVTESVRRSNFADRLIFTGYVPEEDISAIYSNASAFIFPSLAEGFGLPPLEAMRCGTPVICSNKTSLPEVVGDAALLFDPTTEGELSQALWQILTDKNLRERLRQKGLERSQQFSWERYSKGVAECLKRVVLAS